MTIRSGCSGVYSLETLGFSAYFRSQLTLEELEHLQAIRIVEVQRDRLHAVGEEGFIDIHPGGSASIADYAVGDWVLVDDNFRIERLLTPKSSLKRRAAGSDASVQNIANNVDTLFIVSSCNADFNEARLERYLALAKDADVDPVILLTKADLSDQVSVLQRKAEALMRGLIVLPVDATSTNVCVELEAWCGAGQTVALLGSSGVGKTTLLNALTGELSATQSIREDDAKGRHTTTYRSMRAMQSGGWVIDTPGMRALRLHDTAEGISVVFDDITQAASHCRYVDCQHESEPGCAVQRAIEKGELASERLKRWRKLQNEDRHNTQSVAEARKREKKFSKGVNEIMRSKRMRRGS